MAYLFMSELYFVSGGLEVTKAIEEANGFDFAKSWKKYKGKWVAFDMQKGMLCAGKDADQALEKARKLGYSKPYRYNVDLDETLMPAKKPVRARKKTEQ